MKFEWELLEDNERNRDGKKPYTHRAKVFGGWLIKHTSKEDDVALVFVPDPNFEWTID